LLLCTQLAEPALILLPHLCDSALMQRVVLIAPNILKEYPEFFFLLLAIAGHY
jgi:hypothetical protein